ncbi:MAG: hypothetical protein IJ158_03820 [Treponema sp.]|nr:hypothetical protein [Treponema sp.]
MKKFSKIACFLFFTLFTVLIISCGEDAGLGASVDTKAPTLEILCPPSNATIRGTFVFGGKCADDKGIKSVLVSVSKILPDDKTEPLITDEPATLSSDGTWQISLNSFKEENAYNGYEFADGSYIVSVNAYDKAGHESGVASRAFNIDNTAPVLVISKPTSIGTQTPRAYGRTVLLEGNFAENCSTGIKKLTVSFYNENGTGLFDADFENITDMSNANPLRLAQYYDEPDTLESEDDKIRWEHYLKLYGENNVQAYKNGTSHSETIYFTVTASDDAKMYAEFSATGEPSDSTGNKTTEFYRSTSEMSRLITSNDANFPEFTLLSLRNYLNKTDSTYADNTELQDILKTSVSACATVEETPSIASSDFANTSTASGPVYLNFSINPDNNPNYTVNGYAINDSDSEIENYYEGYFYYYAGSNINVSFSYGSDMVPLKTSSISIYYAPVLNNDDGSTSVDTANKQLFWTYSEAVAVAYAEKAGKTKTDVLANPNSYRYTITDESENTDSLSIGSNLSSDEAVAGTKYKFIVEGNDIDGRIIMPAESSGFGLFAKTSTPVPSIVLDGQDAHSYKNLETMSAFGESVLVENKLSFSGRVRTKEEFNDLEKAMSYVLILTDAAVPANTTTVKDSFTVTKDESVVPNLEDESTANDYYEYTWSFTVTGNGDDIAEIINESTSGLFTAAVTIYAKNGGGTAKKDFTYYLDIQSSEIINVTLSAEEKGYSAYEKSTGFYYINNTVGTFTLSGTTTDNYKIGSTSYAITGVKSDGTKETISGSAVSSLSWSFEGIDFSDFTSTSGEADATITISTTDLAGNSSSEKLKVKFDTANPSWKQYWREKGADSDTSFQVGGKAYSFDANELTYGEKLWFKDTSLPVHACFAEEGAGVAAVYYWVVQPGESAPAASDLSTAKGSFSNLTSAEGIAYFTNTLGSFEANDTEKSPAYNTLYLVALDNVGNASAVQSVNLNLDMESPSLLATTSGNEYTNKITDLTLSGTYTDNASGVASVVITVNGKTQAAECTHTDGTDGKSGLWTITLSASGDILKSLADTGSYPVEATITDNAGMSSSSTILTLNIDMSAPKITIETPLPNTDASVHKINGTVTFTGKGNYEESPQNSLQLYYSTTAPTASTTIESLASQKIGSRFNDSVSISSWTVSGVDVKKLSGLTESAPSKPLYIIPVITDTAGNCNVYTQKIENGEVKTTYAYKENENYFVYTVDQNTDRPVIQITNVSRPSDADTWLKSNVLSGTISDDDGISAFFIAETSEPPAEDSSDWKLVSLSNSNTSWSYTLTSVNEGNGVVCFKVVDTEGTTFITTSDDSKRFERPYYLYSGMKASDSSVVGQNSGFEDYGLDSTAVLSLRVDTAAPLIHTVGIDRNSASAALASAEAVKPDSSTYVPKSTLYAGGDYTYIKFFVPVYDDAMIDSVTIKILNASTSEDETASFTYLDDTTETAITSSIELKATDVTITDGDKEYTYYQSAPIVVSEAATGKKTISVSVTDKAENTTSKNETFSVDNSGPKNVNISSPSSITPQTGTVRVLGSASDSAGESGLALTEVLIPDADYEYQITDSKLTDTYEVKDFETQFGEWNTDLNIGTSSSFRFTFTSGSVNDLTTYESLDASNNYKFAVKKQEDGTFIIPILVRTTDIVGNKHIERFYVTHDPDGDRPVTALVYPTESNYDKDEKNNTLGYITLAGVIRMNGTVKVPSNTCDVGAVYIQIGSVGESGITWSSTNAEFSGAEGEFTSLGGVVTAQELKTSYNTTSYVDNDWWGLEATTKSKTWNISLNKDGFLNKEGDTRNIAVRACAINAEGKMGIWTDPVIIHVDSDAPTQTAEVRKYNSFVESSPDENVLSSKEFEAEMYLKGTQYLVVALHDNNELNDVEVQQNGKTITNYTKDSTVYTYSDGTTATTRADDTDTKYVTSADTTLYIPIDTIEISYTSVTFTVSVSDGKYSSLGTYTFKIDNEAPVISGEYDNGTETETSLLSTAVTTDNPLVITNSNYTYSINGTIKETGSGFSKLFFYFMRDKELCSDGRATSTLFDPALTGDTVSITMDSSLDTFTVAQNTSTYTMYGKNYTGLLDDSRTTFSSSGISSDAHIRAGGLLYIGGEYQVIKTKSGDAVTFADAISETLVGTDGAITAGFPYGQLIDSTAEIMGATLDSDYTYSVTNDDGDGMPESVKEETGSNWSISGVLYSDRISDGPVTFVCIAFDEAGNVAGKEVVTQIQNNAPRIAKLYLGTDLTGDGNYEKSEFNEYSFAKPDANGYLTAAQYVQTKELATADSAYGYKKAFKIRSGLVVVPEITGGNGDIKMAWLKDASSAEGYQKSSVVASNGAFYSVDSSGNVTTTFAVSKNTGTKKVNGDYQEDTTPIFVIPDSALPTGENATSKAMSFTFWDSTDGTTIGENSQYCFVRVTDFTVDRADTTKPTSVFSPFYWNSSSDNSVYKNSSSNGHVELEKDWLTASGYTGGSGTADGDPKVSGKITMKGYAYDNQRLSSIWVAFDGFTVANYLTTGGDISKAANGAYSYSDADYYQAAYYSTDGTWKSASATMDSNGWEFSVDKTGTTANPAYLNQDGHKVFYTLSIDTERISGTAGTDKKARIIAFDHNGNVVSVASSDIKTPYEVSKQTTKTDRTDNAPYYQMDVVPYITTVKTTLSNANQNNPSVYARTALGHYPVYVTFAGGTSTGATATAYNNATYETVKIAGFNLKTGATVTLEGTSDNTTTLSTDFTFTIPSGAKSGELSVTVSSVESLNNKNNNASKGDYDKTPSGAQGDYTIYSNYYNRQPNDENNNNLTDDVVLDIWDFNTQAALAYNSGKVDNLEMKINPANGMIGFAFSNGTLRFSMPNYKGGTASSYQDWNESWDYMSHNALAFDSLGYSYAVSVGGDINAQNAADQYSFMTSRWGIVGTNSQSLNQGGGNNDGDSNPKNHLRMDTIGQWGDKNNQDTGTLLRNKSRFQNQSIATHINVSNSDYTDVYLAYYDLLNSEIRFKAGTFSDTTEGGKKRTRVGNFYDLNFAATQHDTNAAYCQIIANGDEDTTLGTAGQYVSVGVTSDNIVVLVWYDGANLQFAYNTKPLDLADTNTAPIYAKNAKVNNTRVWSDATQLLTNAGEFCQLVVAKDDSIHIAAYDSMNANLKYIYIPPTSASNGTPNLSGKIESTVDSYLDVGEQLTIDVAMNGTGTGAKPIPYIGYRGTYPEKPRYAYLADPATFYAETTTEGSVSDTYTGVWECTIVPTQSSVQAERKMSVGVWKSEGVLAASTVNGTNMYTSSVATTTSGTCYGNGTNNGVMAYVVAPSSSQFCAETAQKR